MTTTYEQLCAILVRDYQLQPEALALTAPLEDLGIDSLGLAELLFNVEDELRITLPPEAVDLETVGDVVRYLDELTAKPLAGVATGMGLEQPARPSA
jgi:acyl carrier protein